MITVEVPGHIDEQGELKLEKPHGLGAGKVKVTITSLENGEDKPSWKKHAVTMKEGPEAREFEPQHGSTSVGWGAQLAAKLESGEIDTSEWLALDVPDPVEWLKELRRKERIQRGLEE